MQNNNKYWLYFGSVFFFIAFLICLYASYTISQNVLHVYRVGEAIPFSISQILFHLPGLVYLQMLAIGGYKYLICGSLVLSAVYGLVGVVIGLIYGKIKNKV